MYTRECGEGDCGGGGTRECRLELWPGQLNSNMGVAVYNVSHVLMLILPPVCEVTALAIGIHTFKVQVGTIFTKDQ